MEEQAFFTPQEHSQLLSLYRRLLRQSGDTLQKEDCHHLKQHLIGAMSGTCRPPLSWRKKSACAGLPS